MALLDRVMNCPPSKEHLQIFTELVSSSEVLNAYAFRHLDRLDWVSALIQSRLLTLGISETNRVWSPADYIRRMAKSGTYAVQKQLLDEYLV